MARLKETIAKLKDDADSVDGEDRERVNLIDRQYNADKEKLHKIRLLLVCKHHHHIHLHRLEHMQSHGHTPPHTRYTF